MCWRLPEHWDRFLFPSCSGSSPFRPRCCAFSCPGLSTWHPRGHHPSETHTTPPSPPHRSQIKGHVIAWTQPGDPGFGFGRVQDDQEPPRGDPWIPLRLDWSQPILPSHPHRILFRYVSHPLRTRIGSFFEPQSSSPWEPCEMPSFDDCHRRTASSLEHRSRCFASVVCRRGRSLQVQGGLGRFRDVFDLLHHHHKFVQGLKMDTDASHRSTKRCTRWHVRKT